MFIRDYWIHSVRIQKFTYELHCYYSQIDIMGYVSIINEIDFYADFYIY